MPPKRFRRNKMNKRAYEDATRILSLLKLATVRNELDDCLKVAGAKGLSHLEFLRSLLLIEEKGREESSRRRRLASAHMPVERTIEAFDFTFQKTIKKARVVNLAECRWLENGGNLLFEGPPGVGKTHLAIGLGLKAVEKGYRVRFFQAEDLLQQMYVNAAAGELSRFLKKLLKNDCLILDEFAYLPLDAHAGNYLYQLVSSAYENVSLVITSNKAIDGWGEMFQDQAIAQAILDRFLHHCEVFKIRGESYRLKGPHRKRASTAASSPQGSDKREGKAS
jgi:DNA replication protein DnaC